MYEIHDTDIYHRPLLKKQSTSSNPTNLWHRRLGHINLNRINRLVKDVILPSLAIKPMSVCISSLEGKMTKRPFSSKGSRAKDLLVLVYTDVYGPINLEREKDTSTLSLSPIITQYMDTYTFCTASPRLLKSSRVSSGSGKAIR